MSFARTFRVIRVHWCSKIDHCPLQMAVLPKVGSALCAASQLPGSKPDDDDDDDDDSVLSETALWAK